MESRSKSATDSKSIRVNDKGMDDLTLRFPNPLYQSPLDKSTVESNVFKGITPHQTLGQIAEKIQEQARAAAKSKQIVGEFGADDEEDMEDDEAEDDGDESGGHGTESTGRWTKQEHELFLEALKKYGKEWKKVASMVKTRTVVQTRTHAQKYFQKLAKHLPGDDNAVLHQDKSTEKKSSTNLSTLKRSKIDEITPSSSAQNNGEIKNALFTSSPEFVAPSYYPLDNEQLQPYEPISTPVNSSFPQLFLPPPPSRQEFPQPSPAACGKRKHMELKAAQMLASGGSRSIDIEGARLLSKMKEESIERSVNSGKRFRSADLSLSILNPEGLLMNDITEPGTPWDKEISALEKQSLFNLPMISSSPSDERHCFSRIRRLLASHNFEGVVEMLHEITAFGDATANKDFLSRLLNFPVGSDSQITILMEMILMDFDPDIVNSLYDTVKVLLDHGASSSSVDANGNSALHYAAEKGLDRIGELLLTKGALINLCNKDGDAAVHIAAKEGHIPFVHMLARLGANFHIRNGAALSPLDLAGFYSKDPGEREVLRTAMLSVEPRLRTLILYHQDFLTHAARRPSDWEGPDRLKCIMSRLRDRKEFPDYVVEISSQFEKADVELLGRVHAAEYLTFVNELSKQVRGDDDIGQMTVPFTPQVQKHIMHHPSDLLKRDDTCDTSFSPGTLNAARRAAGAVAHAVDRVMLGRNRNAFCAIRPPGHHAGYRGLLDGADSCGFCIFNNVAAGALHALTEHRCERVAIVDLDIHHGNGTEDIVRRYEHPSRLFFFSLHLYDHDPNQKYRFYPGTGGQDDHVHNIINVPIAPLWRNANLFGKDVKRSKEDHSFSPSGIYESPQLYGRDAYRQAVSQRLIPSLRAFNPDLILLSSGFDAASGDVGNCRHQANSPVLQGMDLSPDDFAWATTEVLKIADICCSGKVVSVLEGGYGEYEAHGPTKQRTYATRSSQPSRKEDELPVEIDANAIESIMNRSILAQCAAAHVHKMIDPYGQARYGSTNPVF